MPNTRVIPRQDVVARFQAEAGRFAAAVDNVEESSAVAAALWSKIPGLRGRLRELAAISDSNFRHAHGENAEQLGRNVVAMHEELPSLVRNIEGIRALAADVDAAAADGLATIAQIQAALDAMVEESGGPGESE